MKQLTLVAVPMICEPVNPYPLLTGIKLADSSDGCRLIGSDQYWDLVTGETLHGISGPVGWVLSGPTSSRQSDDPATSLATHTLRVDGLSPEAQKLDDSLQAFWELESFGITDTEKSVHDEFEAAIHL